MLASDVIPVSVLMPVYNTARYLDAALSSVLKQSFIDFEFVVIDDGSSDKSAEIVRSRTEGDPRVRFITRRNKGLIATRNELIHLARGTWLAWMDSDDLSKPDRLKMQMAAVATNPRVICVGTYAQCIDPDDALLNMERYPLRHEAIVADQLRGGGMRFPTTLMKRREVIVAGGFREPFQMGEDLDLLLRLGERGELANIPETLYYYRQHLASVCATLSFRWVAYRDCILELASQRRQGLSDTLQAGGHVSIPVIRQPTTGAVIAETYAYWTRCALEIGDFRRARRYVTRALRADPFSRVAWSALASTISTRGAA